MNSADNGNGWVEIRTQGSMGLIPGGRVNRDGIGAVLMFTPDGGKEVMRPIIAGSSFESQDSLVADFGLGQARKRALSISSGPAASATACTMCITTKDWCFRRFPSATTQTSPSVRTSPAFSNRWPGS